MVVVSAVFVVLFCALSAVHVYWAFGGQAGLDKAVPFIDDKPAFQPGALLTAMVAAMLLCCAAVVVMLGFATWIELPYAHLSPYAGWALAVIFAVRAVGDFNLVGFFKKVKGSAFAHYDTNVYSPLCIVLSVGLVFLSLGAST